MEELTPGTGNSGQEESPGGIVSLDYIDSGTWAEVNLEIDDSQNLQYGRGKGWIWGDQG